MLDQTPDPFQRPNQPNREAPQEGLSLPAAIRVINPLSKGTKSPEYYASILTILQDAGKRIPFSVPPGPKHHLERIGLLEWSIPYPPFVPQKAIPFFRSDQNLHDKINEIHTELQKATEQLEDDPRASKRARGRASIPESTKEALRNIENLKDQLHILYSNLQRQNSTQSMPTEGGFLRLTEMGRRYLDVIDGQPPDTSLLIVKTLLRHRQISPWAKEDWGDVVHHIRRILTELPDPDLHLRKLYFGIVSEAIDTSPGGLKQRFREMDAESRTDTFLQNPMGRNGELALHWLQASNGGNYCPFPYPSWKAKEKRACERESRKIVIRARTHSYTTFRKLRMETRRVGGEDSLIARFAQDTHEFCWGVHGSDIDMPPGRGLMMAGPRLEKLFHPDPSAPNDALARHYGSYSSWFEPALPLLEQTTVLMLRGWIAILNPCEQFNLYGTRYCFLIDNHHLSPSYGLAFGIPEKVVTKKVRPCLHDIDKRPSSGTNSDLSRQNASIHGLMEATLDAKLPPLVFGTMSQLFGGMVNALPVGFSPTLRWERERQSGLWKDVYNHVHWSWLVWPYREHRPQVDQSVGPMAEADKELRRFVTTGQQLFECVMDRYAAWKNDLTPGAKTAPRMLVEAYKIHHALKARHPSLPQDETIYVGAYDIESPGSKPAPFINCRTLEILRRNSSPIQLPTWSDGTENRELNIWRTYIQPHLVEEDRNGKVREGRYELAVFGDKDL